MRVPRTVRSVGADPLAEFATLVQRRDPVRASYGRDSVRISKIPASHGARGAGGAVLAGETELPSAGLAEDLLTGDVDAELEAEDVAENEAEELDLDGLSDGSAKGEQKIKIARINEDRIRELIDAAANSRSEVFNSLQAVGMAKLR